MQNISVPGEDISLKEQSASTKYIHEKIQEIISSLSRTDTYRLPPLVFDVKTIDLNDPEVKKHFEENRQLQEECLRPLKDKRNISKEPTM